ncbi:MAG: FxLYD domain-containing protein, partial [Methanospirillum sp.]|nr:FxLYD domain-containing protein [Methanospirillum sp.]
MVRHKSGTGIGIGTILAVLIILTGLSPVPVLSERLVVVDTMGDQVQEYSPGQYEIKNTIVRKEEPMGRTFYVKRPFGYVECTEVGEATLSIIKTYVDRVSRDKAYIRGEIKNLDDKTIDVIILTFNLFNADGDQIGNAYVSLDYFGPKKTWEFSTEPIL